MPLIEANHQTQPDHPSWMPLAEANHQSQPDHPSWMPLAEANHQFILTIPLRCHWPKLIIKHNLIILLGCH
jgi:hypothetical protein